jgi:bifunctional non-homologous end joining protein LigD
MVEFIEPMKAKTAKDPEAYMGNPEWVAEEKFDGTRYLAYMGEDDDVHIISRRGVEKTDRLPQLVTELLEWLPQDSILDGEVIAEDGFLSTMSLVGSLGSRGMHEQIKYKYIAFDILKLRGDWLLEKPLLRRYNLLHSLGIHNLEYIQPTRARVPNYEMLDKIWANGGEGVMLKRWASTYQPGKRSSDWLKVKAVQTDEAVILGFNPGEGKYADTIGSIQLGQRVNGKLKWVANASGMTDQLRYEMGEHKQALIGKVIEFAYQYRTEESYRHPRFKRYRPDKDPMECIWND